MNYAIVFRLLGYILMIEGTLLLLPAVTSLIYAEWAVMENVCPNWRSRSARWKNNLQNSQKNNSMKKILILAAAAAVLCSCANKNKYAVDGKVEGANSMVYLFDEKDNILDSAAAANGVFRFEGVAEKPQAAILRDARDDGATFGAMLILEPGTINVTDDAQNPYRKKVTGTPANDASDAYATAGSALVQEFRNPETTAERREAIEQEYEQLTRTVLDQNRDNLFGVMLLSQQLGYELSGQELLDEIAKFPAEMQQTDALVRLKENAEQMIKTDIGQPFIDIAQPNADGEQVSLESVVRNPANKYVLLDFWASWCGPCMGEVPHLKKTYDEFRKKGFEIYGVSFDEDRGDWLGAVEQNDMNWLHVSEVKGFDNQAAKDYAIQGIPSNFLIDGQGTIVARNLRGEALYEKISELLAQ